MERFPKISANIFNPHSESPNASFGLNTLLFVIHFMSHKFVHASICIISIDSKQYIIRVVLF